MKKILLLITFFIINALAFSQIQMVTESVNLRSQPSLGENKILVIPQGSRVTIETDSVYNGSWAKIRYKNFIGYVYAKYVTNSSDNLGTGQIKYYTKSNGERVQSPTYYKSPPAGATAECRDGTYSFSRSRRGTCSRHGGVKRWLK